RETDEPPKRIRTLETSEGLRASRRPDRRHAAKADHIRMPPITPDPGIPVRAHVAATVRISLESPIRLHWQIGPDPSVRRGGFRARESLALRREGASVRALACRRRYLRSSGQGTRGSWGVGDGSQAPDSCARVNTRASSPEARREDSRDGFAPGNESSS